jgi:hypothetical protein
MSVTDNVTRPPDAGCQLIDLCRVERGAEHPIALVGEFEGKFAPSQRR